jgi:pyrroloquinoline quinone biosynthesis protein B
MRVILLGTAAGGGFPQWNCWCPTCRVAREAPARARPRSQSSIAVSADGLRWFLCNASPDVRDQLQRLTVRLPAPASGVMRSVPIEGVILTDSELDHTLGVTLLREARRLRIYATEAVEHVLEHDSRLLPITRAFAEVTVDRLTLGTPVTLVDRDGAPAGLTLRAFAVPGDAPRFASHEREGQTVGLLIHDAATNATVAFIPGCADLDARLCTEIRDAGLILFDGTFWTDDELITLAISPSTARQMGHQPISGPDGSLAALANFPLARRVYTHINNSNPILIEDSPERRVVADAGIIVGADGAEFLL